MTLGRVEVRPGPPTPTGRWLIKCPACGPAEHGTVGPNSVNGYATHEKAMTRATNHARWHGRSAVLIYDDFLTPRRRRA